MIFSCVCPGLIVVVAVFSDFFFFLNFGCSTSYIYKYVLTPMNVVLIEYFPMWMAPNGILFFISLLLGGASCVAL